MHRTKGGLTEREGEEEDYSTEREENSGVERGEDDWGEDIKGSLGNGSGTSGAPTSGDYESSGGVQTERRWQRRTAGGGDR